MCAAAISFLGIEKVRFLSVDPAVGGLTAGQAAPSFASEAGRPPSMAAAVVFLVSVISLRGPTRQP